MWLLLFIILNNGVFETVEIQAVYHTEQQCQDRGNYAASIGIPEGLILSCIKLKGVIETNGKKLQ